MKKKKKKKQKKPAGKPRSKSNGNIFDSLLKSYGEEWLKPDAMRRHGIRKLMTWARRYNRLRYGKRARRHDRACRVERDDLLRENGGDVGRLPRLRIEDGWCIDATQSLPHLNELLEEMGEIVRERGSSDHSHIQQPFLRGLLRPADMEKYPSMLNFITSSEVLATTMDYLKTVPVLSKTRPPGIRFMESNRTLDPDADGPYRESQLYHLDLHDSPLVYVLVAIEDITPECGPWTFLPASVSECAMKALGYQEKGGSYRVTDEEMYKVIDSGKAVEFCGPKGTVLFIDSSRCFHYGSRRSWPPRFQLMYAYTSSCRCDFSQTFMKPECYPVGAGASRLRRMVLE
jgi:hypothetical protein